MRGVEWKRISVYRARPTMDGDAGVHAPGELAARAAPPIGDLGRDRSEVRFVRGRDLAVHPLGRSTPLPEGVDKGKRG